MIARIRRYGLRNLFDEESFVVALVDQDIVSSVTDTDEETCSDVHIAVVFHIQHGDGVITIFIRVPRTVDCVSDELTSTDILPPVDFTGVVIWPIVAVPGDDVQVAVEVEIDDLVLFTGPSVGPAETVLFEQPIFSAEIDHDTASECVFVTPRTGGGEIEETVAVYINQAGKASVCEFRELGCGPGGTVLLGPGCEAVDVSVGSHGDDDIYVAIALYIACGDGVVLTAVFEFLDLMDDVLVIAKVLDPAESSISDTARIVGIIQITVSTEV
ncbi:hypothetical protein BMS3Bbin04_01275 [bacterium BMS3Bbin04]|nr:hypothetical protein BMS3Bbin04_01275 [bacterium BMS3Bbin04]